MSSVLRSTDGVDALITQALATHEPLVLIAAFSPLFPEQCLWQSVAQIPEELARREGWRLKKIAQALDARRIELTATAGALANSLDADEEDVRDLALSYAQLRLPGLQKLAWAARRLGGSIPGKDINGQLARINDARFWRRAIRARLLREREHFFLRLGLIGHRTEKYASDVQLRTRTSQLKRQAQWMKDTVLIPRLPDSDDLKNGPMSLAAVAKSPVEHFAKLYTFVKAMEAIADEHCLASGMLTITLEPEWHPNPTFGANSWNGKSPRDAHRSLGRRWQAILRDLDRAGVGLSGLRVVEPHQDACPHWHLWLIYRPEFEQKILETVMKYFPDKLKIRTPRGKGGGSAGGGSIVPTRPDEIYDTIDDLRSCAARRPTHPKEGAQVELSHIDRSISSGASYAMKYLLKTVDAGDKLNKEAGLIPAGDETLEARKKRQQHKATAKRVDAYRSLWGINAGQLFGVAKCLTAWDELRRLQDVPDDGRLTRLWALARGSDKPGRIPAGAGQRGDAKAFIEALGGLAACGKPRKGAWQISIGRLTTAKANSYGEAVARTIGVTLVERRREKVKENTRFVWRSVKRVLASVVTRLREWTLVPKDKGALRMKHAAGVYFTPKAKRPVIFGPPTPAGLCRATAALQIE